jgi:sigma-B regulation protein RsbU (phosphoserine phosphatase)
MLAVSWGSFLLRAMAARSMTAANILGSELTLVAGTLLLLLLALELRDKLTLKGDLEVARQIQFGLLPFEPIVRPEVAVAALMRPANTVGGDYFDAIDLPDGRLAVVMGDVAGKGMPAALLMALLQGSLRTLLTAGFRGSDLMATLNDHLCAHIPSNRLVTLFYGEYEPGAGRLRYVNAGHNAPFLQRGAGGAALRLPATGMALGVVPGVAFEAEDAVLERGDRLILYTDGVTEACNPADEEYGEERLADYLRVGQFRDHRELVEGVREDVLAFCGAARPRDDMTLLVLARPLA